MSAAVVAPDGAICGSEVDAVATVLELTGGRGVDVAITAAASGKMLPDATDAAADFEHDVGGINADVVQEKRARSCSTRLNNGFILGAADVHLRTGKRFRERRPNALVI